MQNPLTSGSGYYAAEMVTDGLAGEGDTCIRCVRSSVGIIHGRIIATKARPKTLHGLRIWRPQRAGEPLAVVATSPLIEALDIP